jgi:hypothetical protein
MHFRNDPKRVVADGAGDFPTSWFRDEDGARLEAGMPIAGRDLEQKRITRAIEALPRDPELAGDLSVPEHLHRLAGEPASFVGWGETGPDSIALVPPA